MAAEFGKPQWTLTMVTYAFVSANRLAATYTEDGRWRLALVDTVAGTFTPIDVPLEPIEAIRATERAVYFIGGSATEPLAIVQVPLDSMTATVWLWWPYLAS